MRDSRASASAKLAAASSRVSSSSSERSRSERPRDEPREEAEEASDASSDDASDDEASEKASRTSASPPARVSAGASFFLRASASAASSSASHASSAWETCALVSRIPRARWGELSIQSSRARALSALPAASARPRSASTRSSMEVARLRKPPATRATSSPRRSPGDGAGGSPLRNVPREAAAAAAFAAAFSAVAVVAGDRAPSGASSGARGRSGESSDEAPNAGGSDVFFATSSSVFFSLPSFCARQRLCAAAPAAAVTSDAGFHVSGLGGIARDATGRFSRGDARRFL